MERRGERIEGSCLVRDFCISCNEPIRVASGSTGANLCHECSGEKRSLSLDSERNRTDGQKHGLRHTRR